MAARGNSLLRLRRELSNDKVRQRNSMRRRQLIVLIISAIVTRPFAAMARARDVWSRLLAGPAARCT